MIPVRLPLHATRFAVALAIAAAVSAQITPGTLVVTRVGDGSVSLTSAAAPVFLDAFDRFTPLQIAPSQTIAMPIAAGGGNLALTNSGSASSEGGLSQSADGRYLVLVGYNAAPGTPSVVGTASATVQRVVGRVALDGTVDTTTGITDGYSGNNVRGACSDDGSRFWTAGTAGGVLGGVRHVTFGGSTSVQVSNPPTNTRRVAIFDGQLYVGTQSSPYVGVSTVGTGLPTTLSTTTLLNGFTTPTGNNQFDFWFADAHTVYVADERAAGGIQKWVESSGTWVLTYTLNPSGVGCRGLSGVRDQNATSLYAITTDNRLVWVDDAGPGSVFTTLATGNTNTVFRGVQFVRTPYDVSFPGTGCAVSTGVPTIGTAGGAPVSGNANFALTVGNTPPVSLFLTVISIGLPSSPGIPLSIIGGPPCSTLYPQTLDILLGGISDGTGVGVVPVSLAPHNSGLWGLQLSTQHLVFDTVLYGAFGLPVGNTGGMDLVLGN